MAALQAETDAFVSRIDAISQRMDRHIERLRRMEEYLNGQLADAIGEFEYDTQSDSDSSDDGSTVDLRELGLLNGVRFAEEEVIINQHLPWEMMDDDDSDDDATVAMNYTPFDYYQNGEYDSDEDTIVPEYREWWTSPQ